MAWSPDGARIAYSEGCRIWSIVLASSERTVVKDLRRCSSAPKVLTWSPDGGLLAYVAHRQVWVISAEGGPTIAVASQVTGPIAWQALGRSGNR